MNAIDFLRKEYSLLSDESLEDVIGVNMKLDIVIRLMDKYADAKQKLNIHSVMQGLPIEFVEWLGMHYVKMHGGWIHRYSIQIKPNLKTTMEMYEEYRALKDILNIPTIAQTGSRTVGKAGEDASVSDGK